MATIEIPQSIIDEVNSHQKKSNLGELHLVLNT